VAKPKFLNGDDARAIYRATVKLFTPDEVSRYDRLIQMYSNAMASLTALQMVDTTMMTYREKYNLVNMVATTQKGVIQLSVQLGLTVRSARKQQASFDVALPES
jgi:hypothetical protein